MENKIAVVTGVIGAIVSYMFDLVGVAVSILFVFMVLDLFTDLLADIKNEKFNKMRLKQELIIKFYVLLMIGGVYLIDYSIFHYTHMDIFGGNIGTGAAFAYIAIEFISIVDNGIRMNAPISPYIQNIVNIIKEKSGLKGDEK